MKFVNGSAARRFASNQFISLYRGSKTCRAHSGLFPLRTVISLVLLFSLTAQSTLAQGRFDSAESSSTAWNTLFVDASPYIDKMTNRSLAFRPYDGAPCIAYGGDHLYYSCQVSGIWSTTVVDGTTRVGEYAALAFSNDNHPYISYYDVTNKKPKLAYHNGVTWQVMFIPDHPVLSMTLEEDSEQLEEATKQPEGPVEKLEESTPQPEEPTEQFEESTPRPEETVEQLEEATKQSEEPVGQLVESTPQPEEPTEQLEEATKQPEEPVGQIDGPTEQVAEPTEQPQEPADRSEESTFEQQLRQYLQPWLAPLFKSESDIQSRGFDYDESYGVGKHTSIDVDYLNVVHITFIDELEGSFWYVQWNGVDWNFDRIDYYSDHQRVGLWSSIVVDDSRNVHVSYMSEKYDSLKYAHRKPNGSWNICTIDGKAPSGASNWNSVGAFTSIALDTDDDPHISYYDFGNGDLKHAWMVGDECYEVHRENHNGGWRKETIPDSDELAGWYTSIAIDGTDVIHISYYDAGSRDLKYAYKSGGWSIHTLNTGWGNNGLYTSIAIASSGRPGISYFNAEYGYLQYTYKSSGGWTYPSNVSDKPFRDVGLSTSMAIKSNGMPYISYLDTSSGYLKYAYSFGPGWWKSPLLTSPHSGLFSSIQLYGDSYPRVAFYDHDYGNLMWASYSASGWAFSYVDTTYDVGQYVSMALDSTGLPHMSYYDATNQNLIYAYWSTSWYTETLDSVGNVGMYTSIALDSLNKPYISYYDATNKALKYAFKSPINAWITRTIDDPTEDVGLYTSIIVKGALLPYITYYDATNKDLKYAYSTDPNGLVWNIAYVDNSANDVGMYSSLKRYPTDDSLHVCYYDATGKDLKYAKGTGAGAITWVIENVDQTGDVGLFCSMGLDGAGHPAISYYDNSDGDLKIALGPGFVIPSAPSQLYMPLVRRSP